MSASNAVPSSPVGGGEERRQSSGVACSVCRGAVKNGQPLLRCLHCTNTVHLGCQCKLFKDAGNEALRNKVDWLAEFIKFTSLAFCCKACVGKKETVPQELLKSDEQKLDEVKLSIVSLDNKLQSLQDAVAKLSSSDTSTSNDQSKQRHPPTYAQAVSADLVKSAVSEAMREHQKVNAEKSSVVVYGFPEEGHDDAQLHDMLDFLGCRGDFTRSSRMGRSSYQGGATARPLKLELRTANDASNILSRAKYLRHDAYYGGVYINKWLSNEEIRSIKSLRQQCDELNRYNKNDSKKFVVISGRLMQRDTDGRLQVYDGLPDKSKPGSYVASQSMKQQEKIPTLSTQAKNAQ